MNLFSTLRDVTLAYAPLPPTPRLWRTSPERVGAGAPEHLSSGLSSSKAISNKSSSLWSLLSCAKNSPKLPLTPSGLIRNAHPEWFAKQIVSREGFIETLSGYAPLRRESGAGYHEPSGKGLRWVESGKFLSEALSLTTAATKSKINSASGYTAGYGHKSLIRAQHALSILILILGMVSSNELIAHKESFVIVVPSYNNEKCTERVLEMLIHQKTTLPYRIICVNDCSKDRTGEIMDEFARKHNLAEPFLKIIHNPVRKGAMANIYNTIHEQCRDDEIVVLVDGDDFLNSNLVLQRLEREYANPDIWMTYGQFIFYPSGEWGVCYEMTRDDLEKRRIRERMYVSQHLRTFKVKLFKKIKKEHLMLDGEFFAMNADMATMIPMLEMCAPMNATSPMHCKFIPDILYIYNYANPISDFRVDRSLQLDLEKVIRAIKPYEPVETL